MGKWCNWEQTDSELLRKIFEESIAEHGTVEIYTVLNHVSSSGITRYISAFVPLSRSRRGEGKKEACFVCIAREKKVGGCGMDMGFHLAYSLFMSVYHSDENRPYQDYLSHSWL